MQFTSTSELTLSRWRKTKVSRYFFLGCVLTKKWSRLQNTRILFLRKIWVSYTTWIFLRHSLMEMTGELISVQTKANQRQRAKLGKKMEIRMYFFIVHRSQRSSNFPIRNYSGPDPWVRRFWGSLMWLTANHSSSGLLAVPVRKHNYDDITFLSN